MDEDHVPQRPLRPHLPDGLQKRLRLDIADGAADFGNHHVHILAGHGVDPAFDLVSDVGDDLHRGPQIIPPAFPVQNGPVNLAGGNGAAAAEVLVHKALVMPQIQVRFRAVLRNEDLPVLVGTHGAGVHVDIRVELLVPHPYPSLFQQTPQRRRADALSQPGDHAAGDKYVFSRHTIPSFIQNTVQYSIPRAGCQSSIFSHS